MACATRSMRVRHHAIFEFHSLTALSLVGFCFGIDSSSFWQALGSGTSLVELFITRPARHDRLEPATVEAALHTAGWFSRLLFLNLGLSVYSLRRTYQEAVAMDYGRWRGVCQQIRRARPNLRLELTW